MRINRVKFGNVHYSQWFQNHHFWPCNYASTQLHGLFRCIKLDLFGTSKHLASYIHIGKEKVIPSQGYFAWEFPHHFPRSLLFFYYISLAPQIVNLLVDLPIWVRILIMCSFPPNSFAAQWCFEVRVLNTWSFMGYFGTQPLCKVSILYVNCT